MTQYGRPSSDVSTGAWTTTPLWSKIEETSFDDADYAQLNNQTANSFECALSSVTDPVSSTGHIVRIRAKKTGSGTISLAGYLYEGTTLRATISISLTTSFATTEYTLSAAEANSITNYGDLRIRCTGTAGSSSRYVYVSWMELAVPDYVPTTYYLYGGTGSFTESGQSAYLLANRKLWTTTGSFTLTGQNALLLKGYPLKAGTGSFTLAGQNVQFLWHHQLRTTAGSFTESGQNAYLLWNHKLYTTTGSFSLTGQTAKLLRSYAIAAGTGVFTESGQNAYLLWNHKLFTTAGSFTESGQNAYLLVGHKLFGSPGSFILTGMTAIMTYSGGGVVFNLLAGTGSFALTMQNARTLWHHKLFSNVGSFALSGSSILAYGRILRSSPGAFTLTGQNALLTKGYILRTDSGLFVLTGWDAIMEVSKYGEWVLKAGVGTFVLTGNNATLFIPTPPWRTVFIDHEDRNIVIIRESRTMEVANE